MQVEQLRRCRNATISKIRFGVHAIVRVATDRDGATIIEYGMLAGMIAVAAVVGIQSMGAGVTSMFDTISTVFNASLVPST